MQYRCDWCRTLGGENSRNEGSNHSILFTDHFRNVRSLITSMISELLTCENTCETFAGSLSCNFTVLLSHENSYCKIDTDSSQFSTASPLVPSIQATSPVNRLFVANSNLYPPEYVPYLPIEVCNLTQSCKFLDSDLKVSPWHYHFSEILTQIVGTFSNHGIEPDLDNNAIVKANQVPLTESLTNTNKVLCCIQF